MIKNRRTSLPESIAEEVLFRNDHTCCICRVRHKDVQIHHIDSDPANHSFQNLAIVCLDCHSQVTGPRGLGRSYSLGEVRRYKVSWEEEIRRSRGIRRPVVAFRRELVSQIDLIVCDVLARRSNHRRALELLDLLFELHLWRGSRDIDARIVDGLWHLALMTGLSSQRISPRVAELLWEMCFHFVGPDKVRMDKAGESHVVKCIDALETLGHFNSAFGHGRRAANAVTETAEQFLDVGVWYRRHRIARAVVKCYREALEACYEEGQLQFPYGRTRLKASMQRAARTLSDAGGFDSERRQIAALLKWKPKVKAETPNRSSQRTGRLRPAAERDR